MTMVYALLGLALLFAALAHPLACRRVTGMWPKPRVRDADRTRILDEIEARVLAGELRLVPAWEEYQRRVGGGYLFGKHGAHCPDSYTDRIGKAAMVWRDRQISAWMSTRDRTEG